MNRIMSDFKIIFTDEILLKNTDFFSRITPEIQEKIDKFWQKKIKNSKLFNSQSLCLVKILQAKLPKQIIEVSFVDYKNIIASREIPSLGIELEQVGVSGIIVIKKNNHEKILFSRRDSTTTEYPSFYELVPSGNLDKSSLQLNGIIDFKKKISEEFTEETKLSSKIIKRVETLGFVKDIINNVYDVCCLIEIESTEKEIFSALKNSEEYFEPCLISKNELHEFVKTNKNNLVPTSKAILECFFNRF